MQQIKTILLMLLGLIVGLGASAQGVVTGTNLNIGSGNTLTQSGTNLRGNAIGENHWLEGFCSLAVGKNDTLLEPCMSSIALGLENRLCGNNSMALGNGIKIQGLRNIGIGNNVKATGTTQCIVIGSGLLGNTLNPVLYLENDYENSLMIGFRSTRPTLTISPSPNDYPAGDSTNKTGKIAIGDVPIADITAKLHIRSDYGEDAGIFLESKDPETTNAFIRLRDEDHGIEVDSVGNLTLSSMSGENLGSLVLNGRVGVNVTNESNTYALAVNGGILTDEVFIQNVEEWFDHVFAQDYNLMSINDLRQYIDKHGHLPDVLSEAEVLEEGYNMVEMQGVLLKKIEELTLYTLKQQEEIETLKQTVEQLKGK